MALIVLLPLPLTLPNLSTRLYPLQEEEQPEVDNEVIEVVDDEQDDGL